MLLALDDVHWADAASVELLTHLLRRFRGPLLTAVAYRKAPTRLLAALEGSARGARGSRLELAPLGPDDAAALIGPEVDELTRALLFPESGGNPLYLEQLARAGRTRPVARAGAPGDAHRAGPAGADRRDPGGVDRGLGRVEARAGVRGRRGRVVRARAGRRRSPSGT